MFKIIDKKTRQRAESEHVHPGLVPPFFLNRAKYVGLTPEIALLYGILISYHQNQIFD